MGGTRTPSLPDFDGVVVAGPPASVPVPVPAPGNRLLVPGSRPPAGTAAPGPVAVAVAALLAPATGQARE